MTKKKLFPLAMALLLAVTVPLAVLAETYDLSRGSITVDAKADGQYVSQDGGVQDEKQTTDTIVIQDKTESETTSNTITINAEKDTTAGVTISGVDIDAGTSGKAAISTGGEGNVTIELDGENTLKSATNHAGLEKNNGGNLTIGDQDDNGSLTATGGPWAAGIGGGYAGSGTDITIEGGNVTANAGGYAAGIGGGYKGSGSNITITDSNVTATGGSDSAGIGGGYRGSGSNITVSGDAQVKVSGGYATPAIGNGKYSGNGEVTPNTDELGENGSISYFAPGADKSKDTPEKLLHKKDGNVETHESISIKSNTATCTQAGTITYLCSCGEEITQSSSPLGHDLVHHEVKVPTCIETGWDAYDTCSREGCTYTTRGDDLPIDPDNHDLVHHEAKAPTCTEEGWDAYDTCNREGCTYTTCQKIDALNHSFTNYVPNNDATYTQDGTETAQCDHGCGETDTRTIEGSKLSLYRVTDGDGKSVIHKANYSGSTLTITAELDSAILTGSTLALPVLQARGITTIVFVTNGRTSTFELADLLASGTGTYTLTHEGENVTFLLNEEDIGSILK